MFFRNKDIKDYTKEDLKDFVKEKEPESISVEFKREMWKNNYNGKKEMLKDVTAMANAYGGLIFIGVEEENHCASNIIGIKKAVDAQSQILKSCNTNIDEVIFGLEVILITIDSSLNVLVIIIPESKNKPHMVKYENHWRFYKRTGTDNQPISTREIKDMIMFSEYSILHPIS